MLNSKIDSDVIQVVSANIVGLEMSLVRHSLKTTN
jgi:hypothetical protein